MILHHGRMCDTYLFLQALGQGLRSWRRQSLPSRHLVARDSDKSMGVSEANDGVLRRQVLGAERTEGGHRAIMSGKLWEGRHIPDAQCENCSRERKLFDFCLFNSAVAVCFLKDYLLSKKLYPLWRKSMSKGITRRDIISGKKETIYAQTCGIQKYP